MDTSILLNNGLLPFATALAATSGGEFVKPITQVFDNWFYKKFGSKSEFERKKIELKNEHELNLYTAELEKERLIGQFKIEILDSLLDISPENLQIPDQQIVALVMENIHLYLSIDDLRIKFAKVLAMSANKTYSDKIHPLFIETIKNMSPADAIFLDSISKMNFAIVDNISLKSIPNEDGFTHGFHVDDKEYTIINSFVLKLNKSVEGIPIQMKNEDMTNRGFFVENEELLPIYFLEKQNVLNTKKIEDAAYFHPILVNRYADLTKILVEKHPNLIEFQKFVESKYEQKTQLEHNLCLVELSPFGQNFNSIVLTPQRNH